MEATPAAPAQPETQTNTATLSPELAASEAGDVRQFREVTRAARLGKPAPEVKAAPITEATEETASAEENTATAEPVEEPKTETPERKLSKRQEEANERVRKAVEAATADLRRENDELKKRLTPAKSEPATPAKDTPAYRRFTSMANAPKLTDKNPDGSAVYESIEEHAAAMALFIADQRDQERAVADQRKQDIADGEAIVKQYNDRIEAAGGATHRASLSPEVRSLVPVEYLQFEAATARLNGNDAEAKRLLDSVTPRHVLKSWILKSAHAPQLESHLSTHPEDLARIDAARTVADVQRECALLEARLESPKSTPPQPKTLTSAPAPAQSVSTARSSAPTNQLANAVNSGDFRTFQAIDGVATRRSAQRA